ncbi:DUF4245 domain-containing protein [Phytoactinopolyspora halotolerans]|uniref:DUF4245 domain-containing protein n=1 Tax=Phytoactinopolyspora halotolerans TaxID=1981512 RepID=A0A6L9S449_9ACTN|nr:DUF4245 domain-containing protein [Phytoactinopolyspora halotolerans]NED99826.1 DUF4245 domain-containing protein [Phytoactinopolyspora halotolerans]
MASSTRGRETTGDVVRTVTIMFGLLALVVGFFAMNRPEARTPEPVDYARVVELVRREYPYDVLSPASLPENWRATSVDHAQQAGGNRWRVGFLIDDEHFVGLEQADGEIEAYQRDRLRDFSDDGESRIGGQSWSRLVEQGDNADRALVRVDDGVVTIVRGTPSYETLEEFVSWLE